MRGTREAGATAAAATGARGPRPVGAGAGATAARTAPDGAGQAALAGSPPHGTRPESTTTSARTGRETDPAAGPVGAGPRAGRAVPVAGRAVAGGGPAGAGRSRAAAAVGGGLRGRVRKAVGRIEAGTPEGRDRALDGLRALALLAVPAGHWLLGGFTLDGDGALHNASPLSAFGFFAPVSWVLQMLGIFFLVGGYASVRSFRRRTGGTGDWLRRRLARLGRPVLGVTAVWAVLAPVLHVLGVPGTTLRTGATLVIQPLWFVGVYTAITALTPYCVRAARRMGAWAAAPLLAAVAVVDLLRYGPWADAVPGWLGALNILPGWLFAYQLGVGWGLGRTRRHHAWGLAVGGAALFAVLLLVCGYPASMVGVPGEARTNSHPPSLLVLALAAAQSGVAMLLRERLGRALRRPALWAPVVVVNLCAMTILCWHQTAMLAAAVPASFAGAVPGLTTAPDTLGWVAARLAWLPVLACLLALIAHRARVFESPWTSRVRPAVRAAAGVAGAGFAVWALGWG